MTTVKVYMKDINEDTETLELDAINTTLMMRKVSYLLVYQEQFPNWQYAEWTYNGKTEYLFNKVSSAQEE